MLKIENTNRKAVMKEARELEIGDCFLYQNTEPCMKGSRNGHPFYISLRDAKEVFPPEYTRYPVIEGTLHYAVRVEAQVVT